MEFSLSSFGVSSGFKYLGINLDSKRIVVYVLFVIGFSSLNLFEFSKSRGPLLSDYFLCNFLVISFPFNLDFVNVIVPLWWAPRIGSGPIERKRFLGGPCSLSNSFSFPFSLTHVSK